MRDFCKTEKQIDLPQGIEFEQHKPIVPGHDDYDDMYVSVERRRELNEIYRQIADPETRPVFTESWMLHRYLRIHHPSWRCQAESNFSCRRFVGDKVQHVQHQGRKRNLVRVSTWTPCKLVDRHCRPQCLGKKLDERFETVPAKGWREGILELIQRLEQE